MSADDRDEASKILKSENWKDLVFSIRHNTEESINQINLKENLTDAVNVCVHTLQLLHLIKSLRAEVKFLFFGFTNLCNTTSASSAEFSSKQLSLSRPQRLLSVQKDGGLSRGGGTPWGGGGGGGGAGIRLAFRVNQSKH